SKTSAPIRYSAVAVVACCGTPQSSCSMHARHVTVISKHPSNTHANADPAMPNHRLRRLARAVSTAASFAGSCLCIRGLASMMMHLKMRHDVQQRNDKNPHNIDKVPVQRDRLVRLVRGAKRLRKSRQQAH